MTRDVASEVLELLADHPEWWTASEAGEAIGASPSATRDRLYALWKRGELEREQHHEPGLKPVWRYRKAKGDRKA